MAKSLMSGTCRDPAQVLAAQKALRMLLLDRRGAISWPAGRDLAAHLLLHIDDAAACWQLAVEWIRGTLDVERVDGGYASPAEQSYVLGRAEARCNDVQVSSLRGIAIDNRDPAVVRLWSEPRPVVFSDIAQERLFRHDLRRRLMASGTISKIAVALRERGRPFGLLCIDHVEKRTVWTAAQYEKFQSLSAEILGPVLWTSAQLDTRVCGNGLAGESTDLTPAESRVAMLAATGMSYKEIARKLNRSFSTVDHQLRSIRRKLGAQSGARLVQILAARGVASCD